MSVGGWAIDAFMCPQMGKLRRAMPSVVSSLAAIAVAGIAEATDVAAALARRWRRASSADVRHAAVLMMAVIVGGDVGAARVTPASKPRFASSASHTQ